MAFLRGRPLPLLSSESQAFWLGGAHGELRIHQCSNCQHFHHPPLPICPACKSWEVTATPVSGFGTVVSFTINRQPWTPDMQTPFVIAYVQLDEQENLWLMSNIVNCDPEEVRIGMSVKCIFLPHGDIWLPVFQPVETM